MLRKILPGALALFTLVLLVPQAALCWEATAGWVQADVSLDEKGNGAYLGVQESWPVGEGPLVFMASGEYLQKKGSQIFNYTHPQQGLFQAEGTVSLHCVQPAGFLGIDIPVGRQTLRLYGGASFCLKMKEAWDEPEGDLGFDLGYEDIDVQAHLGFSMALERLRLDARYSSGLLDQVVYRDDSLVPDKAEADDLPEGGEKVSSFQVGIGVGF